jgi:peptide/nickel transport system ATP-binding protein
VTIQAQVLDLLAELQRSRGMAMLLITHDLGIVAGMASHVAVMYAGQIVETGPREAFFRAPQHPYSRKLFAALPGAGKRDAALEAIPGQVPPLSGTFAGCRFVERCEHAFERCHREAPGWTRVGEAQRVRCHLRETQPAAPRTQAATAQSIPAVGATAAAPLLEVADLQVHFPIRRGLLKRQVGAVRAVDGVSFSIGAGRTLALVGESGCGKTTVGKSILRLVTPTGGAVRFDGADLARLDGTKLRERRKDLQIVFQDPYASLNPRMRVHDLLVEGMSALGVLADAAARETRIVDLLKEVGLPPESRWRYPHEFSGGQRQRIAIARALAVDPRLLVCDEPTSALDVSVQAQILNLLKRLQRERGLAYLFITHNLAVVDYLADEVAVMYLGRIVEHGSVDEVLRTPKHPYTQALIAAVPDVDRVRPPRVEAVGELPSPAAPPAGCHFHPRCPEAMPECRQSYPAPAALSRTRTVSCLLYRPSKAASSS